MQKYYYHWPNGTEALYLAESMHQRLKSLKRSKKLRYCNNDYS